MARQIRKVSILVLMEVVLRLSRKPTRPPLFMGFNPCFNGSGVKTFYPNWDMMNTTACFNPCFNGSGVKTDTVTLIAYCFLGFNPCFNGSGVKTRQSQGIF